MCPNHPLTDAAVTRIDRKTVEVSWSFAAGPVKVSVFQGPSPESIDASRPVRKTETEARVVIDRLRPDRPYYFGLGAEQAPLLITAERRLPLAGAVNFRDLGGYRTGDSKRVRWGLLFRADNLTRLTRGDLKFLGHLKIATVCDFRTEAEVKRSPSRFPASGRLQYLHMPIQHGEDDPVSAFERIKRGDHQWLSEDFMARGYILSVDHFPALWSKFFNTLASPERRPLLFHCTGGKDRTGTAAALLLSVLGVPEETIVADYYLSARYIAGVLEMIYAQLEEMGVDPKEVAPYFTVTTGRIRILLDHIRKTYGSASGYLTQTAGVDQGIIERLRAELLE